MASAEKDERFADDFSEDQLPSPITDIGGVPPKHKPAPRKIGEHHAPLREQPGQEPITFPVYNPPNQEEEHLEGQDEESVEVRVDGQDVDKDIASP